MFEPDRSTPTLERRPRPVSALVLAGAVLLAGAAGATAQEPEAGRPLVAHEISVSSDRATLVLEFADGERLEASHEDGVLTLAGEDVGAVAAGSPLAEAWRAFLAELAPLDPSEAAERIRGWEPPAELEGESAEAGRAVGEALASAVAPPSDEGPEGVGELRGEAELGALSALLGRTDRLAELPRALEGLELDDPRLHVGENVRVGADEEIAGGLVVLDGNLALEGRVDGHVVVLGGSVDLEEGASVTGNLTVSDGTIRGDRAVVQGRIVEGIDAVDPAETEVEEAVEEAVAEAQRAARDGTPGIGDLFGPLTYIGSGIASLIRLAVTAALLALVGLGLLHFAPRNLDLAARAIRADAGRSALVGLAAIVLAFPLWVAGIVALAVSVIGIPLLLIWLPLFWAVLGLAALFGFVAAAYQVGEWLDESRFEAMDWMRGRSAFQHLALGVAVLLSPFALAAVVSMAGPILSWLEVLLQLVGWLVAMVAATVGTGAVLLTRGGRRPSPPPGAPDDEPVHGAEREPHREPDPMGQPAGSAAGARSPEPGAPGAGGWTEGSSAGETGPSPSSREEGSDEGTPEHRPEDEGSGGGPEGPGEEDGDAPGR